MAYSTLYGDKILGKLFLDADFACTPYLSLHTGDPGMTGAHEVTGYARQPIPASAFQNAASGGQIVNSSVLAFANMPAATVTFLGVWDAVAGGNFVQGGPVTTPTATVPGDSFLVLAGMLVILFSDSPLATDITTFARNAILNYLYRGVQFHMAPAYCSLHMSPPGQTGANEITSYSRQQAIFLTPAGEQTKNSLSIIFPPMPAAVSVGYFGLFDQAAGGNFLFSEQILVGGVASIVTIPQGEALAFPTGQFVISIS